VRSVLLFSRRPPEELEGGRVLVSTSSRTSVLLLELLARDRWHVAIESVPAPAEPGDLERLAGVPHDAVLVIGDAALHLGARHAYPHVVDLGEAWKAWTGLPFVFAVWAARRDADRSVVRDVHRALLASRKWGLAHLDDLADLAVERTGVARDVCTEYLSGLDYGLSYRHLAGLTDFLRRLAARGVVPDGTLAFLGAA
jgi:chorismate dehydratase